MADDPSWKKQKELEDIDAYDSVEDEDMTHYLTMRVMIYWQKGGHGILLFFR